MAGGGNRAPGARPGRVVGSGAGSPRTGVGGASRPRFWLDVRFVLGILLVVGSVTGVVLVVGSAERTVAVYAAAEPLAAGDLVTADQLTTIEVRLGGADGRYLSDGDLPDGGVMVTRSVAAGELVPIAAVGAPTSIRDASIVIRTSSELPRGVDAGTVIDLWSAAEQENSGRYAPPAVLVGSATVVRIVEASGLILDADSHAVEVLVPKTAVARVLQAIANSDAISVVPVSQPLVAG
ncbi:hypothetical protein E6C64_07830 [Naasia lichenicola]|uniref:SAF domain-containing protein n=1 Tax=Naasia lichenicola TaxID=2565933 RepID=A0A4S4FN80_9MICO|nr:hypothetical protein E6C64_08685 [Naasia lichenicola]THG31943.1 hypothetical protein E6C64_07830 [Naasia lichenicola]